MVIIRLLMLIRKKWKVLGSCISTFKRIIHLLFIGITYIKTHAMSLYIYNKPNSFYSEIFAILELSPIHFSYSSLPTPVDARLPVHISYYWLHTTAHIDHWILTPFTELFGGLCYVINHYCDIIMM